MVCAVTEVVLSQVAQIVSVIVPVNAEVGTLAAVVAQEPADDVTPPVNAGIAAQGTSPEPSVATVRPPPDDVCLTT